MNSENGAVTDFQESGARYQNMRVKARTIPAKHLGHMFERYMMLLFFIEYQNRIYGQYSHCILTPDLG